VWRWRGAHRYAMPRELHLREWLLHLERFKRGYDLLRVSRFLSFEGRWEVFLNLVVTAHTTRELNGPSFTQRPPPMPYCTYQAS